MHKLELTKPDGRGLTLYSRQPITPGMAAPSPGPAIAANPHLRWHPLRAEWVAYASFRQGRTFMPPPEYNPLAVTTDTKNPTEMPPGEYDIAVFDNRFPTLNLQTQVAPDSIVATLPARGKCEVVVYTQNPNNVLANLPLSHFCLLFEVWADRTQILEARDDIQFVLPFENRGVEVGVTLHHPHGQIYAYPFIPPVPQRMGEEELVFFELNQRPLLEEFIEHEIQDNQRLLYLGAHAVAFVPACARYPYEVWVAPIKGVANFQDLSAEVRMDLARAFKTVLLKYEGLWQRPFPYLMAWYQAPTDGKPHPESHLHAEFYPPYRSADRLKYLAGTELAAGMFANDALPEEKAKELQGVAVTLS